MVSVLWSYTLSQVRIGVFLFSYDLLHQVWYLNCDCSYFFFSQDAEVAISAYRALSEFPESSHSILHLPEPVRTRL